jgi:hypothetical protein
VVVNSRSSDARGARTRRTAARWCRIIHDKTDTECCADKIADHQARYNVPADPLSRTSARSPGCGQEQLATSIGNPEQNKLAQSDRMQVMIANTFGAYVYGRVGYYSKLLMSGFWHARCGLLRPAAAAGFEVGGPQASSCEVRGAHTSYGSRCRRASGVGIAIR